MIKVCRKTLSFVLLAGLLAGCGEAFNNGESSTGQVRRESPVTNRPDRVLFVGNSLTYYGNVPAVFAALAEAGGNPVVSDMIVQGGATLSERVSDGSVARALDDRHYSALVLQERGGDLICSFGPDSCVQSKAAVKALSALAREKGVRAVLLGSYQGHPDISRGLIEAESAAAAEAGITHIEVSEKLRRLREKEPDLAWFAKDGLHPGKHLALLNAILVHEALLGALPEPVPLIVEAPIYAGNTGLAAELRQADAPAPREDTPDGVRYSSEAMGSLLATPGNDYHD